MDTIDLMSKEKFPYISNDIKNLYLKNSSNLFFYKYHSKYLKKLQINNIDKEDPHYISTYSSFIGEVYENVVYELLLQYAIENKKIEKFILKGPHQNIKENFKNGLMIDKNQQIVYKAGYKDITEFDALFFTKESVYFVESTIVKTTASLRKRLKKKHALLQVLFPKLKVKSLIILSEGALGTSVFPEYCTVWVTKPFENEDLIQKLIYNISKKNTLKFQKYNDKKLVHAKNIKTAPFKYFETLSWILKKSRENKEQIVDFKFLNSKKLNHYFDIFSKMYIGHLNSTHFVELLQYLKVFTISEDIPITQIKDDQVIVTIEKNKKSFEFIYYIKLNGGSLKKLEIKDETLVVSNKDPKGFTASETKYFHYIFKTSYQLDFLDIKKVLNYNYFN